MAQERLRLSGDGRIVLTLKAAWADGTTHLVFEPLELLERLAALTPRPRINLIVYHGVLAPHASGRKRMVTYGTVEESQRPASGRAASSPASRGWTWAQLMRRAFSPAGVITGADRTPRRT